MNATETHLHPFEKAGLGKAPFRCVGMTRKVGPIRFVGKDGLEWSVGAPGQPMGTCDFCGTGIADCFEIRSADGKDFIVGCDCVAKTCAKGERILTQVQKLARDKRNAAAKARRDAAAERSAARVAELLADEALRAKLAAKPSQHAWKAAQGGTALDDAEWLASRCGHVGRAKLIETLEKS